MNRNLLIMSYLNTKIVSNTLHDFYNSNDYYMEKVVKDCIGQYASISKMIESHPNNRTINYIYLLYGKMAKYIYECINSELKCILLKFDKLHDNVRNSSNLIELIDLLPNNIINILLNYVNGDGRNISIEDIKIEFTKLNTSLDPVYGNCNYNLDILLLISDYLNDILEMLYEPKNWYQTKYEYLSSNSGKVIKDIFLTYYSEFD